MKDAQSEGRQKQICESSLALPPADDSPEKEDCACRGTDRRLTISTGSAGAKDEDIVFPGISLTGAYAGL
jgi:hypothetical protein